MCVKFWCPRARKTALVKCFLKVSSLGGALVSHWMTADEEVKLCPRPSSSFKQVSILQYGPWNVAVVSVYRLILYKVCVCRDSLLLEFIWSRLSDGALQHLFDLSFDWCDESRMLYYIIRFAQYNHSFCVHNSLSCPFTRHYVISHRNRCIRAVSSFFLIGPSWMHPPSGWHSGSVFPGLLWLLLR